MRKKRLATVLSLMLWLFCSSVLAAESTKGLMESSSITNQGIESAGRTAKSLIQPRGVVLAYASSTIFDEGNGVIGVQVATLCHMEVDQIRMRIYLEYYDNSDDLWYGVDAYTYDYFSADMPEGESLTHAIASFDVKGKPSGLFYRISAYHFAYLNGSVYNFSTQTDGIKISK